MAETQTLSGMIRTCAMTFLSSRQVRIVGLKGAWWNEVRLDGLQVLSDVTFDEKGS